MHLLDLPGDILMEILSFHALPYCSRVCSELMKLENHMLGRRKNIIVHKYDILTSVDAALEQAVRDKDFQSCIFMYRYYRFSKIEHIDLIYPYYPSLAKKCIDITSMKLDVNNILYRMKHMYAIYPPMIFSIINNTHLSYSQAHIICIEAVHSGLIDMILYLINRFDLNINHILYDYMRDIERRYEDDDDSGRHYEVTLDVVIPALEKHLVIDWRKITQTCLGIYEYKNVPISIYNIPRDKEIGTS